MLHTFKEFLSRVHIHNASLYANNVSKQLIFPFFLPLQKTVMPSETVALSAAPPQRVWVWSPLAPPTCPATVRNWRFWVSTEKGRAHWQRTAMTPSSQRQKWRPWTRCLRTTAWPRAWSAASGWSATRSWVCRLEIIFLFSIQMRGCLCYNSSTHPWKVQVGINNYSVQMKEYVLCVFPSLCGKQQTPDTISIKVEEDICGGSPSVG